MPFKYACFLSYRVGAEPGSNDLYRAFRRELAQQIDLYMPGLGVYLDQQRLRGGDFFSSELSYALCHSVCMIVLFSPQYFDPLHTYCAREYQAMVKLEELRIPQPDKGPPKGLIVPVVIRGTLPPMIETQRQSYSLSEHLLAANDLRLRAVRLVLREIAGWIYERYQYLRPIENELCGLCESFSLPPEKEVSSLIDEFTGPVKVMPWR